jgi:hypothetical protein
VEIRLDSELAAAFAATEHTRGRRDEIADSADVDDEPVRCAADHRASEA